jgi:hypothetical protein
MSGKAGSMDCEAFINILHQMNRPGELESAESERALSHAESCSGCAELLMHVEWLEFSLAKFAEQSATLQAPSRVEAALQQEFRRQQAARSRRQIAWRLAALATAAAFFLAIGLSLRLRQLPAPSSNSNASAEVVTQAPQGGSTAPLMGTEVQPASGAKAISHPAQKQSPPVEALDTEEEASFVQLPYADDSASLDGGAIVRVEMPRASLASFGLPVPDFGGNERVPVDLLLSADGTPEAIRLVSQINASQEF